MKNLKLLILQLVCVTLLSCSGNSSSNTPSNQPKNQEIKAQSRDFNNFVTALTISDTGTVPQIGNASTSSMLYVYNHGKTDISNIDFRVRYKTEGVSFEIEPSSKEQCATIKAGGHCTLTYTGFISPEVSLSGSAIITATYTTSQKEHKHFDQLVNLQHINRDDHSNIIFSSGVNINNYGNFSGCGVVHLFSANAKEHLYKIKNMELDKSGMQIVQGNLSNMEIPAGFIQAVEVCTTMSDHGISSNLLVQTQNGSKSNKISTSLYAAGLKSGAMLRAGLTQEISTDSGKKTGSFIVMNNGATAANISNINFPSELTEITGDMKCSSGMTLPIGNSCVVHFKINSEAGNGVIQVNYSDSLGGKSTLHQDIVWHNQTVATPRLAMLITPNPVTVVAGRSAEQVNIKVTNQGTSPLTLMVEPLIHTVSGSGRGTLKESSNTCTKDKILPIGGECTYSIMVQATEVEQNQEIRLTILGSYEENGNRRRYEYSQTLIYNSTDYAADVVVSGIRNMSINANGADIDILKLTLSNVGDATANIDHKIMRNPAYLNIDLANSDCKSLLEAGKKCELAIKLGSLWLEEELIDEKALYQLTFSGGSNRGRMSTYDIRYIINPLKVQMNMPAMPIISGSKSGIGTAADPYIYHGSTHSSEQTVKLTYQNSGDLIFTITDIIDNNEALDAWELDRVYSSCYNRELKLGGTCDIIYNNILAKNATKIKLSSASYDENIKIPTFKIRASSSGREGTLTPQLQRSSDKDILYIRSQHAILMLGTFAKYPAANNISLGISSEVGGTIAGYPSSINFSYSFDKEVPNVSNVARKNCTRNGGGNEAGDCSVPIGGKHEFLEYTSNNRFFDANMPIGSVKFMPKMQDGIYMALNTYHINGLIDRFRAFPLEYYSGFAYIASDDSKRVIACPIGLHIYPRIQPNHKCYNVYTSAGQIYALRLLPDKQNLLIAGDEGLVQCNIATNAPCKLLSDKNKPLSFISPVTIKNANYEFFAPIWTSSDRPGYVRYSLPIGSNALSTEQNESAAVSNITYLAPRIIDSSRLMIIGFSYADWITSRRVNSCLMNSNARCNALTPEGWKPFKMYQYPRYLAVATYTTDFDNGNVSLFYGDTDNPFSRTVSVYNFGAGSGAYDVKPDGFNKGIFVVVRNQHKICHFYHETLNGQEAKCVTVPLFNYPVAIEILNQAVWR